MRSIRAGVLTYGDVSRGFAAPVKLIACQSCHAQYDVTDVHSEHITCRCGEQVEVKELESRDLGVHRCSSCGAHVEVGAGQCEYCSSPIVTDPRLLSLICPECCARNEDAARFCGACGVGFDPQPIDVKASELPCPVCLALMPSRALGQFAINECPSCNGIWCAAGSFEALVKKALDSKRSSVTGEIEFVPRARGANPAGQGVAYRKCPECDAFMQRKNFRKSSGVIIDRCHSHGTWLDADELEQIAGYLLSGGRPKAERFMRETDAQAQEQFLAARRDRIAAESGQNMTSVAMRRVTMTRSRHDTSSTRDGVLGLIASLLD